MYMYWSNRKKWMIQLETYFLQENLKKNEGKIRWFFHKSMWCTCINSLSWWIHFTTLMSWDTLIWIKSQSNLLNKIAKLHSKLKRSQKNFIQNKWNHKQLHSKWMKSWNNFSQNEWNYKTTSFKMNEITKQLLLSK